MDWAPGDKKMDVEISEKIITKSGYWRNLQESWLHAALMVNDFVAHTAAAAVMLVTVKLLALLIDGLW